MRSSTENARGSGGGTEEDFNQVTQLVTWIMQAARLRLTEEKEMGFALHSRNRLKQASPDGCMSIQSWVGPQFRSWLVLDKSMAEPESSTNNNGLYVP
ncbi:hypothetical protein XELAEV_18001188mg [Xenopus laevis]|nr:hypothetical protein XELAEV_18001188mg [Xenopus laevis]